MSKKKDFELTSVALLRYKFCFSKAARVIKYIIDHVRQELPLLVIIIIEEL